jgi:hypothetical protein
MPLELVSEADVEAPQNLMEELSLDIFSCQKEEYLKTPAAKKHSFLSIRTTCSYLSPQLSDGLINSAILKNSSIE